MKAKQEMRYAYCSNCNKVLKLEGLYKFMDMSGLKCPKCREDELIDLGEMSDYRRDVFRCYGPEEISKLGDSSE